jgi:hypothetical protein
VKTQPFPYPIERGNTMKCPKQYRKNYKEMVKNAMCGLLIVSAMVLIIGLAFVL